MKNLKFFGVLLATIAIIYSCNKDDDLLKQTTKADIIPPEENLSESELANLLSNDYIYSVNEHVVRKRDEGSRGTNIINDLKSFLKANPKILKNFENKYGAINWNTYEDNDGDSTVVLPLIKKNDRFTETILFAKRDGKGFRLLTFQKKDLSKLYRFEEFKTKINKFQIPREMIAYFLVYFDQLMFGQVDCELLKLIKGEQRKGGRNCQFIDAGYYKPWYYSVSWDIYSDTWLGGYEWIANWVVTCSGGGYGGGGGWGSTDWLDNILTGGGGGGIDCSAPGNECHPDCVDCNSLMSEDCEQCSPVYKCSVVCENQFVVNNVYTYTKNIAGYVYNTGTFNLKQVMFPHNKIISQGFSLGNNSAHVGSVSEGVFLPNVTITLTNYIVATKANGKLCSTVYNAQSSYSYTNTSSRSVGISTPAGGTQWSTAGSGSLTVFDYSGGNNGGFK
jgi:hypothetical protein